MGRVGVIRDSPFVDPMCRRRCHGCACRLARFGWSLPLNGIHQLFDLCPRERPAQIGQRPSGLENFRRIFMHIIQQEHSVPKPRKNLLHLSAIEFLAAAGRRALQPFHHARLVALRLQPTDEPGTGIGQAFVIKIDRVLRGQHHTKPERARLLQQRE